MKNPVRDPAGLGESQETYVRETENNAFYADVSYLTMLAIRWAREGN